MWSCIFSQIGHQGADHIEVLPAWICKVVLLMRSFLTCKTEDHKTDLLALLFAAQKEEVG
jgi:hypothetical protein